MSLQIFLTWNLPPLLKIIEIPDESEKSPALEKNEGEVDIATGKEEKEKETGNGDESKEEAEDMSKEKEEKDKTSEVEKDAAAEVKGDGLEGKMESEEDKSKGEADVRTVVSHVVSRFLISFFCHNGASFVSAEEGKDEKMDISSSTEEKKGAQMSTVTHTLRWKLIH